MLKNKLYKIYKLGHGNNQSQNVWVFLSIIKKISLELLPSENFITLYLLFLNDFEGLINWKRPIELVYIVI